MIDWIKASTAQDLHKVDPIAYGPFHKQIDMAPYKRVGVCIVRTEHALLRVICNEPTERVKIPDSRSFPYKNFHAE